MEYSDDTTHYFTIYREDSPLLGTSRHSTPYKLKEVQFSRTFLDVITIPYSSLHLYPIHLLQVVLFVTPRFTITRPYSRVTKVDINTYLKKLLTI